MTLVKICGLTSLEDTLDALDAGADYLGFNFYPDSPRYLDPELALEIFENIPANFPKVGVFVNEKMDQVLNLAIELELDWIQFHGDEKPDELNALGRPWIKAFRLSDEKDLEEISQFDCDSILLDAYSSKAYGGTGIVANWDLVNAAKKFSKSIILAGGLNADNVEMAIASVQPMMLDVASGVEDSPGKKSLEQMRIFVQRAKRVV